MLVFIWKSIFCADKKTFPTYDQLDQPTFQRSNNDILLDVSLVVDAERVPYFPKVVRLVLGEGDGRVGEDVHSIHSGLTVRG